MKRLALATLLVAAPALALAQDAGADAKARYKEGLVHYNLREYKEAIAKFREAYKINPDPAYLYNIAQAYRLQGDCVDAASFYKTFLRDTPAGGVNRDKAARQLTEMEKCIADGKSVDAPELAVESGQTTTPTGTDATTTDTTETTDTTAPPPPDTTGSTERPAVDPTPPVELRDTAPPERSGSPALRYGGLATAGAGVIAIGAGVYFGLQARGATDDLRSELDGNGGLWTPALEDREADAQRDEKLGMAMTIGGAVAVLGGGVLWYLGRERETEPALTLAPRADGATFVWTTDF